MKLKLYHGILFTLLSLTLGTTIALLVLTILDFNVHTPETMDALIFILCFGLLIILNITEIVNTAISLKAGSSFVKNLTYDAINKKWNVNFMIIISIVMLFVIAGIIYCGIILHNPYLPLGSTPHGLKYMIMSFFILIVIDIVCILLFPLTGQQDKAFKIKD